MAMPNIEINKNTDNRTVRPLAPDDLPLDILVYTQSRTYHQGELAEAHSLHLEAFSIKINPPVHGVNLQYKAYIRGQPDPQSWTSEGEICGTRGQSLPIEGFAVQLIAPAGAQYSVQYKANIEKVGDTGFVADGVYCGSRAPRAVDGIEVRVRLRAALADEVGDSDPNQWHNWVGYEQFNGANHYQPNTLQQLIAIVNGAVQGNEQVRAVGSGWAYSEVAVPANTLVETFGLNGFLGGPYGGRLLGALPAQPGAEVLVHVEAGITIHQLNVLLEGLELGLPTAGGSSGQTVCGALSTGTHGGDFNQPPVADMVRAIQLVSPEGKLYWIERGKTSGAISDVPDVQKIAPYIELAHIIYDDNFFNSVLVSFGSMGIIYSLVIAVRPRYWLQETTYLSTWSHMKQLLIQGNLFNTVPWVEAAQANGPSGMSAGVPPQNGMVGPRFVQLVLTPNSVVDALDHGDRLCAVTLRSETTTAAPPPDPNAPPPGTDFLTALQLIDDFRPLLGLLASLLGEAVPVAGGGLALLGAIAPVFEAFLPGASLIIGSLVTVSSAALAAAFPAANQLAQIVRTRAMQEPKMNLQDAADFLVNNVNPELLPVLNKLLLAIKQKPGSKVGLSSAVMDTSVDQNGVDANISPNHFITDSIELFFDASDHTSLAGTIDQLLGRIQAAPGRYGGYVSLRFTGPTSAHLGMQQGRSSNCSVEVTLIKGLKGNLDLLNDLQDVALMNGGRLHWGQLNGELNAGDVHKLYPNVGHWHFTRAQLTRNFTVKTFNNKFTGRCGLDGPPLNPAVLIHWAGQGIESRFNPNTNPHTTSGDGTVYVNPVDLGRLAKVTWNGAVAGNTFNGNATLHFDNIQPNTAQKVSVEVTDVFGTIVTATADVPVYAGPPIPIDPNNPLHKLSGL